MENEPKQTIFSAVLHVESRKLPTISSNLQRLPALNAWNLIK